MKNEENKSTKNKAKPNLSHSDLVSLYSQQWEQIRHLDSLDFRMMALLPIVVGFLTVSVQFIGSSNAKIPENILLVVAVLVIGISFAGCYTTFRNWLCYMRRFAILTALEREMGMVERKIIEESHQFNPSKGYKAFNWKLVQSIRFPLTVFYYILGGCGIVLFTGNISCVSIVVGLVVSLFIFFYCNIVTYLSYNKEFVQKGK
ncbi:MAG: hypothetical protein C5S46_01550 [Candidatus Methanomarinus sp.]|uniref:Uncharacterized protein n=1 Tax=Candidatus Methanomarinus sp. TaxID=3386244 RepID=A0AC61SCD0_9EURY|nr:hypothetical protein C5S42_06115 [ANME-2 cluster archaeon]TKY92265.1 MAG: hypothetical protein C5S46_01550 [ANME-2 cluster archaeon]